MFLITSAAYMDEEFSAEFGRLPPAFLPVGNRLLLHHQLSQLGAYSSEVAVSIPDDFEPNSFETAWLEQSGCKIIRVPPGLSLGESILYCLNVTATHIGPFRILHGDTLIYDLPLEHDDVLLVGEVVDNYDWGAWQPAEGEATQSDDDAGRTPTIAGYFAFGDVAEFIKQLVEQRCHFIKALEGYRSARSLDALTAPQWFDFGHIKTYHRSKSHVTTERAFNSLTVSSRVVKKTSEQHAKVAAEAAWFAGIPGPIRIYSPQLLDTHDQGYDIEYLYLSTLSELYAFGRLPSFVWRRILASCRDFLSAALEHSAKDSPAIDFADLYARKTSQRLEEFAEQTGFDLDEQLRVNGNPPISLREVADQIGSNLRPIASDATCVVHGDLCFSNILYDFRVETIKVIDPRGLALSGDQSIYGDQRYDLAKLYHSIIGRYDHVIAGYVEYSRNGADITIRFPTDDTTEEIVQIARTVLLDDDWTLEFDVMVITVQLFLSMLPLHSDQPKRQQIFLANAVRLFWDFVALREQVSSL